MNLKEMVSQLFICKNPDNIRDINLFIEEGIGGFMIGKGGEIVSKEQEKLEGDTKESLKEFVSILNKMTKEKGKHPLFIAVDAEGGPYFNRLKSISDLKSAYFYGRKFEEDHDLSYFKKEIENIALLMNEIGINMTFGPVVDCAKKGYKGYIAEEKVNLSKSQDLNTSEVFASERAYSDKIETVTILGLTAMEIFQKHNMVPTLKHFPSYGLLDVNQNPHQVLPKLYVSLAELERQLLPYKKAFKLGAYAIMKGHVLSHLDFEKPASLSEKVESFLRDELGFKGLSVVDELNMGAIREYYGSHSPEKAAVEAARANDIILISHPETFLVMRNAIIKEAEKDENLRRKIEESYERVNLVKNIITQKNHKPNIPPKILNKTILNE